MDIGYCFNEECFKMSRRKQGKPQQRRTLDSMEQESDLLVCGDCQMSFPLQDIVHFIKHKKQYCDKENIDAADGACRKPGSGGNSNNNNNNNNNEINGDRHDDSAHDSEEDDGNVSKSLSRRVVGDNDNEDFDDDSDDDLEDTAAHNGLVNGDKDEGSKTKEKSIRRDDQERSSSTTPSIKEQRPPLRQKQMADAESNTTHSEPSRFVCETCRSTYTSAWALLQHAQKEHGMKIYTSTSTSGSQQHLSPSSAGAPIPSTMSPMELVVASSPRSSIDHRSVSTGSGGSISPYPVHNPNPFASPFRLPLDSRLTHPNSLGPFSRSPNIDFDVINGSRLRPQLLARGAPGLDHPLFLHSHFDRARPHLSPALESHYDYYSMRLKQLASSPVVSQTRSPFPSSSQPQAPSITVPAASSFKPDSPPGDSSSVSPRGNSLVSPSTLPPKQKACEFCGKHFRFQSNLVVHRRSHTGEKPYKCPRCPHACTQQSKLKRHMKTHSLKADGTCSPNGIANHKDEDGCIDDDDDEDEDELDDDEEDEEEEECEEEEEDMMEEEMNEEEREVLERMKDVKNIQQDPEPGEICHEAKRIKLEQTVEHEAEEDNLPSDLSMKFKPTESLLSEVMKKTGLNDIQTYNEAYKAALAESQEGVTDKMEDAKNLKIACLDGDDSRRISSPKSHRHGLKRELEREKESDKEEQKERLFLGGTDLLGKPSKRDSSVPSVWSPAIESLPHASMDPASLYSRLHHSWFAENPARLYFPGYPPRFPHSRDLSITPESHNGLNLSPHVATTSSALKPDSPSIPALFKPQHSLTSPSHYPLCLHRGSSSSSSSPTGSLLLPNNNSGAVTPPRKESRRNDTCEFCGKVFRNCSNLTVHRRSHTGEKPYKCNLCSYACAQSSKLTRHMKTHGRLGKDVYMCKFCNMPFSVPSTLEKHMRKCVENRNAGLLATDAGDLSSDSKGELSRQSDSVIHYLSITPYEQKSQDYHSEPVMDPPITSP